MGFRHQGRALEGVRLEIHKSESSDQANPNAWTFTGSSGAGGLLRVTALPPGAYWLEALHLGMTAANFCFHVKDHASLKAKSRLKYEWGDMPLDVANATGELIDSQPGTSENQLWNRTHMIYGPIGGATVILTDPFTQMAFRQTSNADGVFVFEATPPSTYILHVEGGSVPSGRTYQPLELLIRIDAKAGTQKLRLVRRDFGGGSCVDSALQIEKLRR